MLGAMVGAHPKIVCIPEAQFIVDLMPRAAPTAKSIRSTSSTALSTTGDFASGSSSLGGGAPHAMTSADLSRSDRVVGTSIRGSVGRSDPHIWVDQAPEHANHIWKVLQHFTDAKFIHIVRDGRAVAASIIPLDWGPNEIYSAARTWQERVGYGYVAATALGPDRVLHVRYEDCGGKDRADDATVATFLGVEFMRRDAEHDRPKVAEIYAISAPIDRQAAATRPYGELA